MLEGTCDLHLHAGPDVRPRRLTARELVRRAALAGMAGVVLKNHHTPTVLQAAALQDEYPDLVVAGSVVLNEPVGGINPRAADAALRLGARVIWMPTMDAAHERRFRGHTGGLSCLDGARRLSREARDVIALVAEYDAVLGTGHLGAAELPPLLDAAREAGARVVISHPEIEMLNFSGEQQRAFRADEVWFERAYPRANFACDWDGLAAHIRDVGVDSSVIGTDLGQADSIDPLDGLRDMLVQLRARGFTDQELRGMANERPQRLLRGRS